MSVTSIMTIIKSDDGYADGDFSLLGKHLRLLDLELIRGGYGSNA